MRRGLFARQTVELLLTFEKKRQQLGVQSVSLPAMIDGFLSPLRAKLTEDWHGRSHVKAWGSQGWIRQDSVKEIQHLRHKMSSYGSNADGRI